MRIDSYKCPPDVNYCELRSPHHLLTKCYMIASCRLPIWNQNKYYHNSVDCGSTCWGYGSSTTGCRCSNSSRCGGATRCRGSSHCIICICIIANCRLRIRNQNKYYHNRGRADGLSGWPQNYEVNFRGCGTPYQTQGDREIQLILPLNYHIVRRCLQQ